MNHSFFRKSSGRGIGTGRVGGRTFIDLVRAGGLGFCLLWLLGCGTAPETEVKDKTQQEIRGDSDRFFQKMEKEERTQEQ